MLTAVRESDSTNRPHPQPAAQRWSVGGIGGAMDGARELTGNPRRSLAVIVDRIGGGPTQVLLVAVHISVSKTAIHVRAREGGRLPQ